MAAHQLKPQTGTAFRIGRSQLLKVIDLEGEQVADLVSFNAADPEEWLSSGRSIDYANSIYLTKGNILYSNRSRPMWTILADDVGRHDFLLTPCSPETFQIIYDHKASHPSCFQNLADNLAAFSIRPDMIPTTFNIFMNVEIAADGKLSILPPRSRAGDAILLRAEMDQIVGLTACSAEMSNNYRFKPIGYEILAPLTEGSKASTE
ncbi:MAG TPA: urea carboxylase-associated family protein [Chthoniobacterales bacterium]|nr:urea carboxylase-associated family protein [Chthoniobacterales bacterium]